MLEYNDYIARMIRRWSGQEHAFDESGLQAASQFIPYLHGPRIKVSRSYDDDSDPWIRTGTVGITTGWRPHFLLIHRSNDYGSWDVLGPEDKIIAIQRQRQGRYEVI